MGLEPRAWVAATFTTPYRWPTDDLIIDTVVAGRAALAWQGDGIRASETAYVVPLGRDMLVVDGDLQAIHDLGFVEHGLDGIVAGSFAMTAPRHSWELWTAAEAGERVAERPRLYAGSYVTVLAIRPEAVQVRTVEGVIGWIHAHAAEALTAEVQLSAPQASLINRPYAKVVHENSVPLREMPRSQAPQVGAPLAPRQTMQVLAVAGDWLHVGVPDTGRMGWIRWYYDGNQYIDQTE